MDKNTRLRQSSRKPSNTKHSFLSLNHPGAPLSKEEARKRNQPLVLPNETDHKIIELLSRHRVATTQQIAEILDVPERTIRYRLTKLRQWFLVSYERPYSVKGRSANYNFPTRYGDAIARGLPLPRGGDRKDPSVFFLRHSAGITELYCALSRIGKADGFELVKFLRETEARETFRYGGRSTGIVPDVSFVLKKGEVEYHGLIELDLGTMSGPRITKKLGLYASYVRVNGWEERHPYCPTLFFITTTKDRVARVLSIFSSKTKWEEKHAARYLESDRFEGMLLGACDGAARPQQAITDPAWETLDRGKGLALKALLHTPWERYTEKQTALTSQQENKDQQIERLAIDPEARRAQIHAANSTLPFTQMLEASELSAKEKRAMRNLLQATGAMSAEEKEAFKFFERRLRDKSGRRLWDMQDLALSSDERTVVAAMADAMLRDQKTKVANLYHRHPESATLRRAIKSLNEGILLDLSVASHLEEHVRSDLIKLARQEGLKPAYFAWRKWAVGKRRAADGLRGKIMRRAEEEATNADLAMIHFCKACEELLVPVIEKESYLLEAQCMFCSSTNVDPIRKAVREGAVAPDGNGFWEVKRPPLPGWVSEMASGRQEDTHRKHRDLELPKGSKFRIHLQDGIVARGEGEEDGYVPSEDYEEDWAVDLGQDDY